MPTRSESEFDVVSATAVVHDALLDIYTELQKLHKQIGSPVVDTTPEHKRQQFNEYVAAIVNELSEIQGLVPWKPWKKIAAYSASNKTEFGKELFDVYVFINSIGELHELSPEQFAEAGASKFAELCQRTRQQYYSITV